MRADPVFAAAQVAVLAKIVLVVVLLDPRSIDTFTLPKSVATHSMSFILAALLVWLLVRHGRTVLFWSPLHLGAGALLLAFALATPFAVDPTLALFGTFKRYLGLTQMLDNVLLYVAVGTLFRDARSLRLLAGVGVGVAVPVLGYGLIQFLGLDPLQFREAAARNPISTLGNPDITGSFVSVLGVTALGLAWLLGGRVPTWWRAGLAVVGTACILVLYAAGIRAGVLAIGAGWAATIVLAFRMRQIDRPRALGAAAVAVVLAAGVILSPIGARLDPGRLAQDQAVLSRLDIWRTATVAVLERPVLGVGPDNFTAVYPSRRSPWSYRTRELQSSTHDIWLYAATSAGAAGLAALAFFVALLIGQALRLTRVGHPAALALVPLAAYLGQALVSVNEIALDWMFWTAAGAIAGSGPALAPRRLRAPRGAPAVGAVGLAAALLLAFVTGAPRIAAGEAMLATDAYTKAGLTAEAFPYGIDATRADPRRGEAWSQYAVALHSAGYTAAALKAFQIAAERQPWSPLSWKNLAAVWTDVGNRDAAYAAAQRIPETDPYDGAGLELLSSLAYERGDYARAASAGESAIAYEVPPQVAAYFTTASAHVRLKDLERAEQVATTGLARYPGIVDLGLLYVAILADRGKTPEALAYVDGILRADPNNADAKALRDALLKR